MYKSLRVVFLPSALLRPLRRLHTSELHSAKSVYCHAHSTLHGLCMHLVRHVPEHNSRHLHFPEQSLLHSAAQQVARLPVLRHHME